MRCYVGLSSCRRSTATLRFPLWLGGNRHKRAGIYGSKICRNCWNKIKTHIQGLQGIQTNILEEKSGGNFVTVLLEAPNTSLCTPIESIGTVDNAQQLGKRKMEEATTQTNQKRRITIAGHVATKEWAYLSKETTNVHILGKIHFYLQYIRSDQQRSCLIYR